MKFSLTILGVNSATPAYGRHPTSQILHIQNHFFLLDCGEGTQMRMSDFKIPRQKINQIFISHLHGDHVFGLPGLLFTLDLNNRTEPLEIYSPPGLQNMILAQLNPSGELSYPIQFHEIDPTRSCLIFENKELTVNSVPLKHRIPTAGFVFREKPRPRNMLHEKIIAYNLSVAQIKKAKSGEDISLPDGTIISNNELTVTPPPPRSFAYISDTMFDLSVIPLISGVDLLYHESTFCEELTEQATLTMHSTAKQAATIAKMAGAGRLILGHYSSRYKDLVVFQEEAREVFARTELGVEGGEYEIPFKEDRTGN